MRALIFAELDRQIARLEAAIAIAPAHATYSARHYLAKLRSFRIPGDLSAVSGLIGPNGYGPGIDDAIRDCESGHARYNRRLMGPAFDLEVA